MTGDTVHMRLPRLDALRGTWMLWMAGFHFAFDLAWFRITASNFYTDPVWSGQRLFILSGFLFWAGVAQALAADQAPLRFWRRWAQVSGAALLVSLGSWFAFPQSWISFGVLHAFVLLLPLARWGGLRLPAWALIALALLALLLPLAIQLPALDGRALNWIGLVSRKPVTEDYVPLLPWATPLLLGLLAARSSTFLRWLAGPAPACLDRLGQWPLSFYLLHQPVLIGLLWLGQRTMAG